MNYSYSSEWIDFLNMGRISYDENLRQIVTNSVKNFAFYHYDHPPYMNDHLVLSSTEYLKGRMEIPFIKARKYLPISIQEDLQKLISEIYIQVHSKICEKRFNISQIGFVWNKGSVPYHSHCLPEANPFDTITYFMALHEAASYALEFNIEHPDGSLQKIPLLTKRRCTRVHFNSNLNHELRSMDDGLYMFFLFNAVQLKRTIASCEDIQLGALT